MPSDRKSLTEMLKELAQLGQRGFALRYNAAALVGVGKVTNLVEEGEFRGGRTQVISVPSPDAIKSAEAYDETKTKLLKQPPASFEFKTERSGNTDMIWFIPYSPTALRLGRRQDNHLVIAEPSISGLHCNFRWTGLQALSVTDSGASNGVWIGQNRLPRGTAYQLKGDELILLGRFQFRFFYSSGLCSFVGERLAAKAAQQGVKA